jgi:hypothetical protein
MAAVRASVLLAAITVALAVPLVVLAGGGARKQTPPSFAFGRNGGNILPFTVKIARDGTVTATSSSQTPAYPKLSLAVRNALAQLAQAEGFFTMSTSVACSGTNPDVAAQYVTVSAGGKTRTVSVHGGCKPAFSQLWSVLYAAVGLG